MPNLWLCLGISFHVSNSMGTPQFCLSVYIIWHLISYITMSIGYGEEMRSFHCSTKGVHAGQLPCVGCQEKSTGFWGLTPTIGVDLVLPLFYVSKHCSTQFLNMLCFSWTLIPGWTKVFRLLLLVMMNRYPLPGK